MKEPPAINSLEANAARAIANARREGNLSIAVKGPRDYQMFVDRVASLIAAEYEPLVALLREAVAHPKFEADGQGGLRYYITEREISRARELLGEKPNAK